MSNNYFETIRAGVNTTFQDKGRNNLYHIGIPFSGAMDNRNYLLANKLVGNKLDLPVIEFAYQGPLLRFYGDKINIVITGDVVFKIKQNNKEIDGNCYETYELKNEDEIDILSTNKSVYGYLAISGSFDLKLQWGSCSINTKANIGSNEGKKLEDFDFSKYRKVLTGLVLKRIEGWVCAEVEKTCVNYWLSIVESKLKYILLNRESYRDVLPFNNKNIIVFSGSLSNANGLALYDVCNERSNRSCKKW